MAQDERRVAIVTGAASGIGAAVVRALVAAEVTVVGCDLNADRLTGLEAEVGTARLSTVSMDVADPAAAAEVHARAASLGPVAALANVAGINDGCAAPHEVTDDVWGRVMAIDLTGPMRLCRAVLPGMMERGAGSIVNVSSIAGFRGGVSGAAYTAAKHALVGLTRSIAVMYARDGIRCNAVCPGSTRTNIAETDEPQSEFSAPRLAPIRALAPRRAPADEVGALIAWLASDAARNVNGAIIPCDAGWTVG